MSEILSRVAIVIGGDSSQAKKAIRETEAEIAALQRNLANKDLFSGIKDQLRTLKKSAGLLAAGVGAFMGSGMASGFKESCSVPR